MNEEQRQSAQSLIKHYEQARSGKIVGSVGLQHRTSPISYSNESSQDYAIYTPKTANGSEFLSNERRDHDHLLFSVCKSHNLGYFHCYN